MPKATPVLVSHRKRGDARSERVIRTLESIVRDYKAGRGDVLNRFANHYLDEEADSLGQILAGVLLGGKAVRKQAARGGAVVANRRDHRVFRSIGEGFAERGVALVIRAACRWAKKDPAGMARWFLAARPSLDSTAIDVYCGAKHFVGKMAWDIPVRGPAKWYELLYDVIEAAAESVGDVGLRDDLTPDDILRAMAHSWKRQTFGRRVWAVAA